MVVAQFGLAFSINYLLVFLPFYIRSISGLSEAATLLWTGLVLGAAPAASAIASPLWGLLTARVSPKRLYERGLLSHSLVVAAIAFTTNLPLLLALRLLQGIMGGISTIAIIIIGAVSPRAALTGHIGLLNSALTAGVLLGPPVGAALAAAAGFRPAILSAAVLIAGSLLFCHWCLPPVPPQQPAPGATRVAGRRLAADWLVSLTAMVQIVFLPSVLPQVLAGYGITGERAVATAGLVVMAYGTTAAAGAAALRWLGRLPRDGAVLAAGAGAALLQGALALAGTLPLFVVLRMLQTLLAGLVMPLLMARVAATGQGAAVGILNTARFVGNALGPILATGLLAHGGLGTLYLTISLASLASLAAFAAAGPATGRPPAGRP